MTALPKFFEKLDKRIAQNSSKDYIVGKSITIADFVIGSFIYAICRNEKGAIAAQVGHIPEQYANVKHWADHFKQENNEYLSKRQPRPM
eukprot:CAMPEP_0202958802 /NCGR_PEP_ID=MMETSP1396-20130829/3070_1 /ASSEMBLY_ACC=CAM_ASM_000872 /TAXON_ID= /ORGANISM="Pseudokeronopsis sp., Strain Brazil" /LENGTH=88 /DNA_ID=CAMNT_0049677049 /DNA_START=433 /DNA_END=699 /DNA_ORIENTATION=-